MIRSRKSYIATAAACLFLLFVFKGTSFRTPAAGFGLRLPKQEEPEVVGGHPYVKPTTSPWRTPMPSNQTGSAGAAEKAIIVAKLSGQDITSVTDGLSGWYISVRTIHKSFSRLYVDGNGLDRGRVAAAYLAYIIENYYRLPKTMVFLNPARNIYTPSEFNVNPALRNLSIDYVQRAGFASLRCNFRDMCLDPIVPFRLAPNEFRTMEIAMPSAWEALFNNTDVPKELAAPCCSEFAVSREQVKNRRLEEYQRYWKWLHTTGTPDGTAGLVLEYLWHVIFGMDAVYCPDIQRCECELYGRCA